MATPLYYRLEDEAQPPYAGADHGGKNADGDRPQELGPVWAAEGRDVRDRQRECSVAGPGVESDEDECAHAGCEQARDEHDAQHRSGEPGRLHH